jgi:agarase
MQTAHRAAAAVLACLAICAAAAAAALDEYGGRTDLGGRKTGFFGLEKIRDRWWFVTPAGNAFLSKGVEEVALGPGGNPIELRRRLGERGFNTLGPLCPENLRGGGLAYTVLLNLSKPTMEAGANVAGRRFPDVFDPRFERIATEIAGNICPLHADNPWLLGYFSDDALEWRCDGPGDLADAFLALPGEAPGKRALVAELRRLYDDKVEAFNSAWGLSLESFDQLLEMRELRPGARFQGYAVSRDRAALLSLIAGRYFAVASEAIRSHDPHHLVLGCRFARPPAAEVLAAMGNRMDVVSIAAGPGLTRQAMTQMHSDSGLPLLVTPLGVSASGGDKLATAASPGGSAPAAGAPAGAGGGQAEERTSSDVAAQAEAAACQSLIEELGKQGFVVGYSWPRCFEEKAVAPGEGPGQAQGQEGPLMIRVTKINERFYTQASLARLKPTLFDVVERYELRRAAAPGITVDGDLKDWESAMPMELRPSAYETQGDGIEAQAYLMWDAGAVYFAGRLYDPAVEASTVTSYVGADWIELGVAAYSFRVTLLPGYQTVTDRRGRTKPAELVIGRVYARPQTGAKEDSRRIAGYAFEGSVKVGGPIPQGLVSRFGLALHHYTRGCRELRLSFPYYWLPANPGTAADIIIAGRARE